MKKFKIVFYSIYFLFLVASFLFIPYDQDKIFSFLVNNLEIIPYWIGIGIILYIAIWIVENIHIRFLKTEIKNLKKERDALKVRMYDMEAKHGEIESSLKSFNQSLPNKKTSEGDQ